jgi:hypothetical protein
MRKLLAIGSLVFLSVATCAAANPIKGPGGPLIPSPDPAHYYQYICDATPGVMSIYIVYTAYASVTGVEFWAPKPSCFTAVYLSDTMPFPVTIGNSQAGVSIGLGSCRQPPVHVLTINYFAYGTTPADCQYRTLPHPVTGEIYMVDCADNLISLTQGINFINPPEANCEGVPVGTSTWGSVKSLFSD